MASVSLLCRLTLNCKLSRWTKDIGALTVKVKAGVRLQVSVISGQWIVKKAGTL